MAGGFVLCDYDKVRLECPEYKTTMDALEVALTQKAMEAWAPKVLGGMYPHSGQFGKSPIMPELFQGYAFGGGAGAAFANLATWRQWFGVAGGGMTVPGHNTIMQGSGTSGTIYEDYMVGLAGIAFLDKVPRVSEIKMQISDKKLPRINIEEAWAYKKPCLVFEDGYILDEETSFHLYAYVVAQGPQKIKLIGLQLDRIPNKMQVTNTGASIQ